MTSVTLKTVRAGRPLCLLTAALGALLFSLALFAQGNFGRILGTVTDQTGAVIAGAVMLTIGRYDLREDVARQVVAGHIRSQLAPQPFDVASSDRHTVKPWFTSRLPESPQVPDLAAQGFVLVGGRIDVVGQAPVATIVYKHAKHTVSLTTLTPGQSVSDQAIAGYNVRSWSDAECTYIAVSDISPEDLASFERAFSEGSPASEIK